MLFCFFQKATPHGAKKPAHAGVIYPIKQIRYLDEMILKTYLSNDYLILNTFENSISMICKKILIWSVFNGHIHHLATYTGEIFLKIIFRLKFM